jgi:hypothetical protein
VTAALKQLALKYRAAKATKEGAGLRLEYAIMATIASAEALAMQARTMTILEFGVYKGDGLLALVDICRQITDHCGLKFRLYGFDSGTGLPRPRDHRDHPEIWREGDFIDVDYVALAKQLPPWASLEIGAFTKTVPAFCREKLQLDQPLGFVSIDSDLYSSASVALQLFECDANLLLPTVPVYFDDVDDILTFNSRCGEALAIREFNERNPMRLIERKRLDMHGYFACHVLDHPARKGAGGHASLDIRVRDY